MINFRIYKLSLNILLFVFLILLVLRNDIWFVYKLIELGPRIVIITSTEFGVNKDQFITLYGACKNDNDVKYYKIDIPLEKRKDGLTFFMGTGDLLSCMLLAQHDLYPDDFTKMLEYSVNILHQVVVKSIAEPSLGPGEINITGS